jgi:hypothetical protein
MDIFFIVELKIKVVTFYHHTLKYHNTQDEKNQARKNLSNFFKISNFKFQIHKVHFDI